MAPEQVNELVEKAQVQSSEVVTGAFLVLRGVDMESGNVAVHLAVTEDTDWVTQMGLLTWASEIMRGHRDD